MLTPLRTPKEQVPAGRGDRTTFTCVTHSGYPARQGNSNVKRRVTRMWPLTCRFYCAEDSHLMWRLSLMSWCEHVYKGAPSHIEPLSNTSMINLPFSILNTSEEGHKRGLWPRAPLLSSLQCSFHTAPGCFSTHPPSLVLRTTLYIAPFCQ
jgi:hypothetical protein